MADDWQIGDLALCVKVGQWKRYGTNTVDEAPIRCGGVYVVRAIGTFDGHRILWLEGIGGELTGSAFIASRFRKITPPEADEFDRETIALLNRDPAKEPAQ